MSETPNEKPFPEWLKIALTKPGRSQSALARRLRVDSSAVNRLVNGKRDLRLRELDVVSAYLVETNATPDEIEYLAQKFGRASARAELVRQSVLKDVPRVEPRFSEGHFDVSALRRAVFASSEIIEAAISTFSHRGGTQTGETIGTIAMRLISEGRFTDTFEITVEALHQLQRISADVRDDLLVMRRAIASIKEVVPGQATIPRKQLIPMLALLDKYYPEQDASSLAWLGDRFLAICSAYALFLAVPDANERQDILTGIQQSMASST